MDLDRSTAMCFENGIPERSYASVLVHGPEYNLREHVEEALTKFTPMQTYFCSKCMKMTLNLDHFIGNEKMLSMMASDIGDASDLVGNDDCK